MVRHGCWSDNFPAAIKTIALAKPEDHKTYWNRPLYSVIMAVESASRCRFLFIFLNARNAAAKAEDLQRMFSSLPYGVHHSIC
jgi:hypothetical protein